MEVQGFRPDTPYRSGATILQTESEPLMAPDLCIYPETYRLVSGIFRSCFPGYLSNQAEALMEGFAGRKTGLFKSVWREDLISTRPYVWQMKRSPDLSGAV
jgi:hypothetical protein